MYDVEVVELSKNLSGIYEFLIDGALEHSLECFGELVLLGLLFDVWVF